MSVDGSGGGRGVSQITLDDAQIHTGFQQMGRIRVSEGMDRRLFWHPAFSHCGAKGALQPTLIHGLVSVFLEGGKQPDWVTMGHPVQSQELQTGFWQGHIAIFASFSRMHVNEFAFAIDIFDLQADPFQQTQPAGIDRREAHSILLAVNAPQHTPDFRNTQDHWQLFLFRGTQKLEGLPLPTQRPFVEELDPAQRNTCTALRSVQCRCGATGAGGMLFILEEQEILAQFLFLDLVR